MDTNTDKLKEYMDEHAVAAAVRPDGRGAKDGKIRAAHLLVKHKNSRRPSSWREANITRTKDEAISILKGHERRIRSGEVSLGDLSRTESDCSSARKKGDLFVSGQAVLKTILNIYCAGAFSGRAKCRRSLKTLRLD